MAKSKLKALLKAMDKEEIIALVLELYSSKPEAKEYLDFFVAPNETEILNKYKQIIAYEFYPGGRKDAQVRFSVCRKALSDFKKLKPSGAAIVELMVFYMENACEFAYDYGDMWEQFYDSVEKNFEKTLQVIVANDLWKEYDARLQQCLKWASTSGWGFPDELNDMYLRMKPY